MESISDLLSPFDELEIICEKHGIPCLGLCSNTSCNSQVKLFCMKCIKSGETCITKEKHELITVSEILLRFFKSEDKYESTEIKEFLKMNKIINNYDKKEINNILFEFKNLKEEKHIKQLEKYFHELINFFIEKFKLKNNIKLEKIKNRSKSYNKKYEKDINILLKIKLPEINEKNIDSNKKIKEIIKKGYKLSTPRNFVNSVKLLNNISKVTQIANRLNKKIYINKVYSNMSNINDKRKKLENKIDKILNDLENKFEKKMENIEKLIILPKDNKSIYISKNISFLNFSSDPKNLKYKGDICINAHKHNSINKVFCAFKSFSNETFIVWGTNMYFIEFFDLDKNEIVKTIKNAHINVIYSCRHYPDKKNKIDYLITSSHDRNVKIWDISDFSCKLTIYGSHMSNHIYSVSILFEENKNMNYVITSCPNDFMKIYDFSGKLLQKFGQMDENTYFLDTYYDNKTKKYFILNGNSTDVKSYNFKDGEIYQIYKGLPLSWHMSVIIHEKNEQQILIESDGNGYIRMWEFHTANLIKCIFTNSFVNLRGVCLWNERYLFAGGSDHQIKLFDLIDSKCILSYKEHTSAVCTLDKSKSKIYGECLLSQGTDGKIKIWISN